MSDEEQSEQQIVLFYVQGNNYIIRPSNIIKIIKEEYIDEVDRIVYTIDIYEKFGEKSTVKFFDEMVRDKEHLNLISKFEEQNIRFL